mmetsp:Transcript_3659/g.8821  ORF Transcript_3659/g.8821 Transcript_3659/m.8821 type:complete len:232 (+) Transcript_3659:726-1421(+)
MHRLIAATWRRRRSARPTHAMEAASPARAASTWAAAVRYPSHTSEASSSAGKPESMPAASRQWIVPTREVRAISARLAAGSALMLVSRSHGTCCSREERVSAPMAALVVSCRSAITPWSRPVTGAKQNPTAVERISRRSRCTSPMAAPTARGTSAAAGGASEAKSHCMHARQPATISERKTIPCAASVSISISLTVAGHASRSTASITPAFFGAGASSGSSWKPVAPRRVR